MLDVIARPCLNRPAALANVPAGARVILITAHRRESFGEPFRELCLAIRDLALEFVGEDQGENVHFVYPVHLNPHVQRPVEEILSALANVHLMAPLDYLGLVQVMRNATLILTDSGGIQEEAPSLRVPVLVMRETTERPEGVEAGVVRLVGTQRQRIVAAARELLTDPAAHAAMARGVNPYGDGHAAERIVAALLGEDPVN